MGKILIGIGVTLVILGLLWQYIGKLPGNFMFKKGNVTFYFPLTLSIIASIVISVIFYIIGRFK
ncbi:DUF2905 domain-containing protein [Bacillus solimangrovi]|uniref:DUF2905 domain-containing protein n=1 Tax=Bacillus solimangrovi TaxID=1305675 RepID=A0A1E5LBL9_9BACI|nr:DUF2905 domain-containing protein [Bacillus solimangrovi]OEH91484.1 hypothetical protein BFG57_05050 [Bacillus solimangrovi]